MYVTQMMGEETKMEEGLALKDSYFLKDPSISNCSTPVVLQTQFPGNVLDKSLESPENFEIRNSGGDRQSVTKEIRILSHAQGSSWASLNVHTRHPRSC